MKTFAAIAVLLTASTTLAATIPINPASIKVNPDSIKSTSSVKNAKTPSTVQKTAGEKVEARSVGNAVPAPYSPKNAPTKGPNHKTQTHKTEESLERRFIGGWCGLHVHYSTGDMGDLSSNSKASATVKVVDSKGNIMMTANGQSPHHTDAFAVTAKAAGGMPNDVLVTLDWAADGLASFEYGTQSWVSPAPGKSDSHCKVGKVDDGGPWGTTSTVDMDCGFTC